jgi:hypothetical protein
MVGTRPRPVSVAALIARFAALLTEPSVPVIVAVVFEATADVVILNVAEVAPAGTVTVEGTWALVALDDRDTIVPAAGAAPFKVTVPVDGEPPRTEVGETLRPDRAAAVINSEADLDTAPSVPVIVAMVFEVTADVVILNVAEVAPAETVTVEGTWALVALDDRDTIVPAAGASPVRVTVPVAIAPPTTLLGATLIPDSPGGLDLPPIA